ncbi:MAG: YdcF family protein [Oscillospiraceae bacterium]|nr:YdcF family protein [Oscillospiraceae bacterium]
MKKREKRLWPALTGGLLVLAALLRFTLRGYAYWAYALCFVAALIVIHRFAGPVLWRVVVILVCIGLVYFCIVEVPIIKNARTDRDDERPYLVVLGAAVYGDRPSLTLVRRLEGAQAYLERYPDSTAIVSGGMGPGETVTEAQAMRDWLVNQGVAQERILLEDAATSTKENLEYSYAIIRSRGDEPDGNVAIVSSAYHLYRAKLMSRQLGAEAAGVAAPWGYFFVMLNYFIREAFGVTHLWVFGW